MPKSRGMSSVVLEQQFSNGGGGNGGSSLQNSIQTLFFPASSFQVWSLFDSCMKKETFALDQFRQQAGKKHSLKENQQQRKKPKHPKQVVTWGVLPFFPLTM